MEEKTVATNRQARHQYHIIESYEVGIELKGSEVKSIRQSKVNLKDSFASIDKSGIYLYNCHISPYEYATVYEVDPVRRRKLLMHKAQIMRLLGQTSQKGFTLVPLKMYFKHGLCKVELALAKGKKLYDKRRAIKDKEARREIMRAKDDSKRRV
jgi:SsrA-binding protein